MYKRRLLGYRPKRRDDLNLGLDVGDVAQWPFLACKPLPYLVSVVRPVMVGEVKLAYESFSFNFFYYSST